MKKLILLVTGFSVLATGAYFSSGLLAQGTGGSATTADKGTKVAVVNIGYVFSKYKRADTFKKELEAAFAPFKEKAKKLTDEMKQWEDEMVKKDSTPQRVEQCKDKIKTCKRELEDLSVTMQKTLGKQQEENLLTLWKDVNLCIQKCSEAYGFQIVLGYGDPLDKGLMDLFPNINRKMQAMDGGAAVPLYVHGSIDLSHAVTETLNRWIEPKAPVVPAGGTK